MVPADAETKALQDEKKLSSNRRQFVTGAATALGAGLILNATASEALAQTAVQRQIISFKLTKTDLASIGEVVTRLQVTASGVRSYSARCFYYTEP